MKVNVEITGEDIKKIVYKYLLNTHNFSIRPEDIHIEVKSKQNYKSEWEEAEFRVRILDTNNLNLDTK